MPTLPTELTALTTYEQDTVLVICIGASPAILTETIYGMWERDMRLPKRIVVFTTKFGYESLKNAGFFNVESPLIKMVKELGLPHIPFELDDVRVVKNARGEFLNDVNTEQDNTNMADMITEDIRNLVQAKAGPNKIIIPDDWYQIPEELTRQIAAAKADDKRFKPDTGRELLKPEILKHLQELCAEKRIEYNFGLKKDALTLTVEHYRYQLHMSPSGGRKTMTFFSGYIMTLLARPYDVMSHVLIDDKAIGADFYYPTKDVKEMTSNQNETFCPADIEVKLSLIPFVRHANTLPSKIKNGSYSSLLQFHDDKPESLLSEDQQAVLSWASVGPHGNRDKVGSLIYKGSEKLLSIKSVIMVVALHRMHQYAATHYVERKQSMHGDLLYSRFSTIALLEVLGVNVFGDEENEEDIYEYIYDLREFAHKDFPFIEQFEKPENILNDSLISENIHDSILNEFFKEPEGNESQLRLAEPINISESAINNSVGRLKKELFDQGLLEKQVAQLMPVASKQSINNVPSGKYDFSPLLDFIHIHGLN